MTARLPVPSWWTNAGFKTLGELLVRAFAFLFMVLAGRVLGQADFGRLAFGLSFPLLFLPLLDPGLTPIVLRESASDPGRSATVLKHALGMKLVLAVVFLTAVGTAVRSIGTDPAAVHAVQVVALFVLLQSFTELLNAVFQARQRMDLEAWVLAAQKAGLLVLGGAVLALGWALPGVSWAYVATAAGGLILAGTLLRAHPFLAPAGPWRWTQVRSLWQQAWPLALSALFLNLYFRVDLAFLAHFRPVAEVGWFGAARKCQEVLMAVPAILCAAALPGLARGYAQDREGMRLEASRLVRLLLVLGVPLAVAGAWQAGPLLRGLFGEGFGPAGLAGQWLGIGLGFIFVNYGAAQVLLAGRQQAWLAGIAALAAVLSLAGNAWLVPRFGYQASAWTAATVEGVLFLVTLTVVRVRLFPLGLLGPGLKTVLAGLGMSLVFWGLRSLPPALTLIAAGLTYGLCAWGLRLLGREDLRALGIPGIGPSIKPQGG